MRLIDLVRALDDAGIDAIDVDRRQSTLDDVFLTLTTSATNPAGRPDMTATLTPTAEPAVHLAARVRHGSLVSESLVFARRHVEHIRQLPEKLLDVTLQPLMFVLLFTYVFGGAIVVHGGNYREYLIGGILIQSLAFGLVGPGDVDRHRPHRGRHRPLPFAAGAALGVPRRPLRRRSSAAWRWRPCCS